MDCREYYKKNLGTLAGALEKLKPGDVIATGTYGNMPNCFLDNLHTVVKKNSPLVFWTMNVMGNRPFFLDESIADDISFRTNFYDNICRQLHPTGRVSILPVHLSVTGASEVSNIKPSVFVIATSPMDENGKVYFSFDLQMTPEQMAAADTVIFEINSNLPRTCGETGVSIEDADYFYEADSELSYAPRILSGETDLIIADYVSSLIHDGDCIQLGIGGMPNAVGANLLEKHDLGIHTEMIASSMGKLMKAGVVNNSRKNFNKGKTIGCFAWGDQALYDYLTDNEDVQIKPANWVNNPFNIAQNDNMVSVNTALQVDLSGQICSESLGYKQFSGSGGAFDFAYGAYMSKGGRGIIAISSTAKNGTVSKIQPILTPGSIVTIPRNVADYVVTEYGIAKLRDRTMRQRVDNLIAVAHPDFRADLKKQADEMMLW